MFLAPLLIIKPIGHLAHVMSLSGSVSSAEGSSCTGLVPLVGALRCSACRGTLQALIFIILTMVYLGGAVAVEREDEAHRLGPILSRF